MINYIETLGAIILTICVVFLICFMSGGIYCLIDWLLHRKD